MKNIAEIDLSVIKQNALNIKATLSANTKFCAVVKANAYGHGASEVAKALKGIADYFAVAILEEALELRKAGITTDILILIPLFSFEYSLAIDNDLTITIDNIKDLKKLATLAMQKNKRAKVHLKLNTGMNRCGIDDISTLEKILKLSKNYSHVQITGMFSHLACPEKKKITKAMLDKFSLANSIIKEYNSKAICHVSASGGYLLGLADYDMVRIGLMLYGYKPFSGTRAKVKPVLKLIVPVIKTRTIKKGQSVMYGYSPLSADTVISIIRLGYADGLERKSIKGQIGNRCMDVTAIKGKRKRLVISNVKTLAKAYGTIPYEILTKITMRASVKYKR